MIQTAEEKKEKEGSVNATMTPKEFIKSLNTAMAIFKDTIDLLQDEKKVAEMETYDDTVDLGKWLAWASDHLGTLTIELEQNLNEALKGHMALE